MSIAMNAVSRHFEWEADRFAVELQDKLSDEKMNDMGDRLGRALIALHVKNLSTVWVDWLYVLFSLGRTFYFTANWGFGTGILHIIILTPP